MSTLNVWTFSEFSFLFWPNNLTNWTQSGKMFRLSWICIIFLWKKNFVWNSSPSSIPEWGQMDSSGEWTLLKVKGRKSEWRSKKNVGFPVGKEANGYNCFLGNTIAQEILYSGESSTGPGGMGVGTEELSRKDPSGSRRVVGMLIRILWSSHD